MIRHKPTGFTIVELLIVIVVIGILAAITIVAFNGIQQRARNTQTINGATAYHKAILQYATLTNSYPTEDGCLGAGYPSNVCWRTGSSTAAAVSSALDGQLNTALPTASKPTLATSLLPFTIGATNYERAGARWVTAERRLIYYLQGTSQQCSISGAVGANEGGVVTQCNIVYPAL